MNLIPRILGISWTSFHFAVWAQILKTFLLGLVYVYIELAQNDVYSV
jgi:hypothetical protein